MNYVLDACALIAFLRGEPGSEVIESILVDGGNVCTAHSINLYEVYYDFIKVADDETASAAISELQAIGIMPREDMDTGFWQEAGRFKAANKISVADTFAIALAKRENAILLTSDHHEFDPIIAKGNCPINIEFFR